MAVVDLLEVVDVDDDQRERHAGAVGAGLELGQAELQGQPRAGAGDRVLGRPPVVVAPLEGAGHQVGQGAEEGAVGGVIGVPGRAPHQQEADRRGRHCLGRAEAGLTAQPRPQRQRRIARRLAAAGQIAHQLCRLALERRRVTAAGEQLLELAIGADQAENRLVAGSGAKGGVDGPRQVAGGQPAGREAAAEALEQLQVASAPRQLVDQLGAAQQTADPFGDRQGELDVGIGERAAALEIEDAPQLALDVDRRGEGAAAGHRLVPAPYLFDQLGVVGAGIARRGSELGAEGEDRRQPLRGRQQQRAAVGARVLGGHRHRQVGQGTPVESGLLQLVAQQPVDGSQAVGLASLLGHGSTAGRAGSLAPPQPPPEM